MKKIQKNFLNILRNIEKLPRLYFIYSFFAIFFWFILFELFSFTIINHNYYKKLADNQQISNIKRPIPRWNILTSDWWIVATSVMLDDLAIDPSIDWNKNKLANILTDLIYNEICYLQTISDCKYNLWRFLKKTELNNFSMQESFLKDTIKNSILENVNREYLTSVLLVDNLTNQQSFDLEKFNLWWVYINWSYLYINPQEIKDIDFIANKINSILQSNIDDIKHSLRKRKIRYISIFNKLSISWSEKLKKIIKNEKNDFNNWIISKEEMFSNFIILNSNQQRFYPEWKFLSQVLWYVNNDNIWLYWIEWYFDNILKWKDQSILNKKDTRWRIITPISLEINQNDKWSNIYLTIDRNIQKYIEEIIDEDIFKFQANKMSVIVMNPKT